tara:strand:+ start:8897 stop:9835 length:939 start_codon:yes stop_codon:yes gene_type:complete
MAQHTRTWAEVVGLTQARSGAAFSSGTELANIGFLLNSAARTIYDESRYWERYLVLEPRTAARGYIATTEDGFNVYGGGFSPSNGLYVRNGDLNGKPSYNLVEDGSPKFRLSWNSAIFDWQITALLYITSAGVVVTSNGAWLYQPGDVLYLNDAQDATPPGAGWITDQGADLPPYVDALSEIGEAMGYWSGEKWDGGDPTSLTAYPDKNGIRVASNVTGTVYVAFKKSWTDTFGNGESGTLAKVPTEWAEFMAYDAARSYRASQGGEDGFNPIALRDVNNALERALMKVSRSGAIAALTNQLKTQYSVDNSV